MLYEGIPVKKKNEQEKAPAHPAPVNEQVFGRQKTRETIADTYYREEEAFINAPAPFDDAVFGKQVRTREAMMRTNEKLEKLRNDLSKNPLENLEDQEAYTELMDAVEDKLEEFEEAFFLEGKNVEAIYRYVSERAHENPRDARNNAEGLMQEAVRATCSAEVMERRLVLGRSIEMVRTMVEKMAGSGQLTLGGYKTILQEYADEYKFRYLPLAKYVHGDNLPVLVYGQRIEEILKDPKALESNYNTLMERVGQKNKNVA